MTDRRVALLRGINVGRAKRVTMGDLRALVEGLGYSDVRTLLNSGNVVFTAPRAVRGDVAGRIEEAIATRLGVPARVIVLTAADLAAVVKDNPLGEAASDPSRLLVTILNKRADRARLQELAQQDWTPEILAIGESAAYVWCAEGILAGRLFGAVDRALGDTATSRNWATIKKLHALVSEAR